MITYLYMIIYIYIYDYHCLKMVTMSQSSTSSLIIFLLNKSAPLPRELANLGTELLRLCTIQTCQGRGCAMVGMMNLWENMVI